MDNPTRSERSRQAAIQAAFAILSRDGPGELTFETLSRESGISKGGLLHHFGNKHGILKALLAHQVEYFEQFSQAWLAKADPEMPERTLMSQLAIAREAINQPHSVALAIIAAMVEDPELLASTRKLDVKRVEALKEEADDVDLALVRWAAARGLIFIELLGLSPLPKKERDRVFDCLLDQSRWSAPKGKK
ncbi:TetR/AcrR family transcriptional regulator [Paraburkholderia phosphatilytica]|uniref:TetR/AcrR family transcriptional regulator n=1 Tax=Paraburkholderia phosphatilytica TaxID=2282883 RepID=UPI000E53D2D4|nr:TetR/AcrR family transcriptional regulator [Paraburkholderia phosphatilytica]